MPCLSIWRLLTQPTSVKPLAQLPQQVQRETPTFQYMSDLHLEKQGYRRLEIHRAAPYLILAGDIGNIKDYAEYFAFLEHLCQLFDRVFLIPGNHEFFHLDRPEAQKLAAQMQSDLGERFVWMDRGKVDIEINDQTIVLLGCTLHSRIAKTAYQQVQKEIQDFSRIGSWRIEDHNAEHEKDRKWLKSQLSGISKSQPEARVVVATHFPPTWDGTSDPKFEEKPTKSFFGSKTLNDFQSWRGCDQVTHWIFGHTHWNAKLVARDMLLVSNQGHHSYAADDEFRLDATI